MTTREALRADTILDAAIEIVRADGHEKLSMRALAANLGVTAPALYDHFGSRHALLRAAAERGYAMLATRFAAIDDTRPGIERARQACFTYVRFAADEPELFRMMFLFRPDSIEAGSDNVLPAASAVFDRNSQHLRDAIAEGDLAEGDAQRYGAALWAATHGVATVAAVVPPASADDLTTMVVDSMLRGWAP